MEDRDLKDVFKTIKEKKRKERMERVLVYLSGVLLALVFVAIGLNLFSRQDKTVSEPEVKIVKDINQPLSIPVVPPSQPPQQVSPTESLKMEEVNIPVQQEPQQQPVQETQQTIQQETMKQTTSKPEDKEQQKEAKKDQQSITKLDQKSKDIKQKQKEEVAKTTDKKEKPAPETTSKPEQKVEKVAKQQQSTEKQDKDSILSTISSGFFSIQVGAFSTREKAIQEKSKYSNAFIIEEGGLYKVLVGRFDTEKEARDYKNKNGIDGFIKRQRE